MEKLDFAKLKKEIEKSRAENGEPKSKGIVVHEVLNTLEEFKTAVVFAGTQALSAFKNGLACDYITVHITNELSEQLADTPENEKTWDDIYECIPNCIMAHTSRCIGFNGENVLPFFIMTDFKSEMGKKEAEEMIKFLNL